MLLNNIKKKILDPGICIMEKIIQWNFSYIQYGQENKGIPQNSKPRQRVFWLCGMRKHIHRQVKQWVRAARDSYPVLPNKVEVNEHDQKWSSTDLTTETSKQQFPLLCRHAGVPFIFTIQLCCSTPLHMAVNCLTKKGQVQFFSWSGVSAVS